MTPFLQIYLDCLIGASLFVFYVTFRLSWYMRNREEEVNDKREKYPELYDLAMIWYDAPKIFSVVAVLIFPINLLFCVFFLKLLYNEIIRLYHKLAMFLIDRWTLKNTTRLFSLKFFIIKKLFPTYKDDFTILIVGKVLIKAIETAIKDGILFKTSKDEKEKCKSECHSDNDTTGSPEETFTEGQEDNSPDSIE